MGAQDVSVFLLVQNQCRANWEQARGSLFSGISYISVILHSPVWKSDKGSGAHGAAQCECLLASRSSSLTPLGVFRLC